MLKQKLHGKRIILGSKSPRRKELLATLNIPFEVVTKDVEEIYPDGLSGIEIAEYLSKIKAEVFIPEIKANDIVITSDTIVLCQNEVLGKPGGFEGALEMLGKISGNVHEVITGVTILTTLQTITFSAITKVYFKSLALEEIEYYVHQFQPFDKAGAYGIQEWIGQIGITKIEGSYYNVMGLPIHLIYKSLHDIC